MFPNVDEITALERIITVKLSLFLKSWILTLHTASVLSIQMALWEFLAINPTLWIFLSIWSQGKSSSEASGDSPFIHSETPPRTLKLSLAIYPDWYLPGCFDTHLFSDSLGNSLITMQIKLATIKGVGWHASFWKNQLSSG